MTRRGLSLLAALPVAGALLWSCSVVNKPDPPQAGDGGAGLTSVGGSSAGGSNAGGSNAGGTAAGGSPPGCGDGTVDASLGETCDPPSDCPTSCDDMDTCTTDSMTGQANQCNVECANDAVTVCELVGDGCCPTMTCNGMNDADCALCGNNVIDFGEVCDGNCPATCNDMIGCTTDTQMGAPATCDMVCTNTTITSCTNNDGCCAMGCTPITDNNCMATTITRDHIHRGWWNNAGTHDSTNDNTLTGDIGNIYNSYFIFDLSGITGTVIAVTLRLNLEMYTSPDATETCQVWDVTTPPATLEASGTNVAIFNDLQSGIQYATFTESAGEVNVIKSIPLNAQAVASVQAALGNQYAVGVHNATASSNQWVRFSAGSEQQTHQLVIALF